MRILLALGGNALLRRGDRPDASIQRRHVIEAAQGIARLTDSHEIIITHGNGPQVGMLADESFSDRSLTTPYPLDVLDAQTQGMIGYWLMQALHNERPRLPVVAVITQVEVEENDPAFHRPKKFVGPAVTNEIAAQLSSERGWKFSLDGSQLRRVVASPMPKAIVELDIINNLVHRGKIIICAGGGGIPVIRNSQGKLKGVDAVIDKDATAAMLAVALECDLLVILTDVPNVYYDFSSDEPKAIGLIDLATASSLCLPDGSMGPKVTSACSFVRTTGNPAVIGSLEDVASLITGTKGTRITTDGMWRLPLLPRP
ncbi:MAG: carbamate kinase [Acidimicrobiales bacterium]